MIDKRIATSWRAYPPYISIDQASVTFSFEAMRCVEFAVGNLWWYDSFFGIGGRLQKDPFNQPEDGSPTSEVII